MASDEVKQTYRRVQELLRGVSHAELEGRLSEIRSVIEGAGIGAAKKARKRKGGHDREETGGMDRAEE